MSSRCNLQVCQASFFPAITIRYSNKLQPGIFLIQIWYRMSEVFPFEIQIIFSNIWKKAPFKTLYLPVSSADNFCKQFVSRSGSTKCQAWSGSILFATGIPERIFEKIQQTTKKHAKFTQYRQELFNTYLLQVKTVAVENYRLLLTCMLTVQTQIRLLPIKQSGLAPVSIEALPMTIQKTLVMNVNFLPIG